MTPRIPNSPPAKGSTLINAPAPIQAKSVVKRKVPHAAHPNPSKPLVIPRNPVARVLCLISEILCFRKKTTIATSIPNNMAVAIVYEAESRVKLVLIEPSKLIGKPILKENGALDTKTELMSFKLGNQTASMKTARLMQIASSTYQGLLKTLVIAFNTIERLFSLQGKINDLFYCRIWLCT